MKPKVLIFSGYGLNCEEETAFAFSLAGGAPQIVHINDLIERPASLLEFQIIAFPGGFAYGDDTGAGNAFANKIRNSLFEELQAFIQREKLVIGICNGFQILSNLGVLPAFDGVAGKREAALVTNDKARYSVRFVDLEVTNHSVWLKGIQSFISPIAHGEGKFYVAPDALKQLQKKQMIALRYVQGEACAYQELSANPNGSIDDIAGITDESGRILGLMPHPERAMFFTQTPDWPVQKDRLMRSGKTLPAEGPGLQLFKNAVQYFYK